MAPLSRRLGRMDMPRMSAAALGLAVALLLAPYVVELASAPATPGGLASAIALAGIAGAGLLYAWRLGAAGLGD